MSDIDDFLYFDKDPNDNQKQGLHKTQVHKFFKLVLGDRSGFFNYLFTQSLCRALIRIFLANEVEVLTNEEVKDDDDDDDDDVTDEECLNSATDVLFSFSNKKRKTPGLTG